ncbi:MAG: hypothetical protein K0B07_03965 [DPANN group archaeon]|nr:hypothetical protein [DPANN group archaeon]
MVYGDVYPDMSLSGYCNILLENGFLKVCDNYVPVDLNDISGPKVSIWVDVDKGYFIELVGNLQDDCVAFANMYYELETQRDFECDEYVRKWMKSYFDCVESRLLLGSENTTLIRHVRKDVTSGLSEYLLVLDEIYVALKGIDSFGVYGGCASMIQINRDWVHLDKHPIYPMVRETILDYDVKKM